MRIISGPARFEIYAMEGTVVGVILDQRVEGSLASHSQIEDLGMAAFGETPFHGRGRAWHALDRQNEITHHKMLEANPVAGHPKAAYQALPDSRALRLAMKLAVVR